jgi:hypothetical protein
VAQIVAKRNLRSARSADGRRAALAAQIAGLTAGQSTPRSRSASRRDQERGAGAPIGKAEMPIGAPAGYRRVGRQRRRHARHGDSIPAYGKHRIERLGRKEYKWIKSYG